MKKNALVIFLLVISSLCSLVAQENTQLLSADDRRVILYNQYKNGQKIISTNKNEDIALLQEHMKELQKQKKEYDSFYQRNIVPYAKIGKSIFMNIALLSIGSALKSIHHWDNEKNNIFTSLGKIFFAAIRNKEKKAIRILSDIFKDMVIFGSGTLGLHIISQRNAKTQELLTKINKLIERDQAIIEKLKAN